MGYHSATACFRFTVLASVQMARIVIAALVLAKTCTAMDGNSTSNLRGRSLQSCNYRCPENSRRKPNRRCYDTFDDCECDRGFQRDGRKCVADEPCFQIRCSRDQVLVGADSRGCGGRCEAKFEEPCFQIRCSRDQVLVGADSRGCGGRCEAKFQEPCFQIQCSRDQVLVGADSRGCGGRCEAKFEEPGREFRWSFDDSYCMSVDDNKFQNGQKMQLWTCAGGSGQYFRHSQNLLLQVAASPEFCVVIDGNNNYNGARIQLWKCDANNRAQQWFVNSKSPTSFIRNVAFPDKCLVVDSNKGAQGQRLQLWSCDGDEQYKMWGQRR